MYIKILTANWVTENKSDVSDVILDLSSGRQWHRKCLAFKEKDDSAAYIKD